MDQPIYVTYYTSKTLEESRRSGEKKMFSRHTKESVPDNAILVGVNKETKAIARVAVSDGMFEQRSLLDPDVFVGPDAKYQKSELKLKSCRDLPQELPLSLVGALCGIPMEDKTTKTNLTKCTACSYARIFYNGDNAEDILKKYRTLILALL